MGYYLAPFVEVPWRRRRTARRVAGYDLAPHNFVAFGRDRALVWFDDPVSDARLVKVADGGPEKMAATTRAALAAHVKDRQFSDANQGFAAAIVQVLKAPPTAWRFSPLRPQTDGEIVVWLGPGGRGQNKFASERTKPEKHSRFFADNFHRSDGSIDGSLVDNSTTAWTVTTGVLAIVSDQISTEFDGSGPAGGRAATTVECDTDNQFAQHVLTGWTWGSAITYAAVSNALFCNCDATLANGYWFDIGCENFGGGFDAPGLSIIAISTFTILDNNGDTPTIGGRYLAVRNGSSLEIFLDDVSVLGPVTDSSESSGAGFRHVGFADEGEQYDGTASTLTVDNWRGGDYAITKYVLT